MAHLRVARIMEQTCGDRTQVRFCYAKILDLFPQGAMCLEAGGRLRRLPACARLLPIDKRGRLPV